MELINEGMTLTDFLKENGVRQADFAAQIGRSASYVSMICSGQIWPSRETMEHILNATGGKVTPNDFLREHGLDPVPHDPAVSDAAA